jgi:hypothetical protein
LSFSAKPSSGPTVVLSARLLNSATDIAAGTLISERPPHRTYDRNAWLQTRAEYVFSKLSTEQKVGKLKALTYFFEFDASGPVLKEVRLNGG